MENVSIGNELKDAFKKTDKWLTNNLTWLSDIESFYKQRAAIEKEYATKLQTLCSESFKKKAKVSTTVSVGDEPSVTPGSLENSTLVVWNDILNKTELIAKDKLTLANDINDKVAEKIATFQRVANSLQKRYNDLNAVVTKEKSDYYSDLKKAKQTYDSACEEMEHVRSKSEKSSSTSNKLNKKLSEKEFKMNVRKNAYLIKINQTNRLKDKFYYQDLPEILDGLQDINEFKTIELNKIWKSAISIETSTNNSLNDHLQSSNAIISRNDFHLDTIMYIKHNMEPWQEPEDFYYEPSPIWHDDDQVIIKSEELLDLKKRLAVANKLYLENDQACEKLLEKIGEINQLKASMKNNENVDVKHNKSVNYYVDESVLSLKVFIVSDNKRVAAEVEMQTIQSNAGDKDLTLTGPLQQKKKSRLGFLKRKSHHDGDVAVSLSSSDLARANSTISNHTTKSKGFSSIIGHRLRHSSISSQANSVNSSAAASGSVSTVLVNEGKASYDYLAEDEDEVSVSANETFEVIETDDGSGWTRIQKGNGESGLVPTSYIVISQVEKMVTELIGGRKKGAVPPKVAPRRGGKKLLQAKVLYDYQADGDDEMSLQAGDTVAILEQDDGSGWTMGELKGSKGLFPTSYVQLL